MGDELGIATDIDRLLVCSGLVYTIFHVDRERGFLGVVTQILGKKCRQKSVILSFLGYLGEIESDSQKTVWTSIRTI